jgi:hypothetical protein
MEIYRNNPEAASETRELNKIIVDILTIRLEISIILSR